ncbi:MAG: sigma-70 family RNA polymerase sigma factor [Deltaproteobacteria bacterium]|nr:sigma-70 family RNA polymerase sigma factor [Deltaproteobacteria bacterium]MBN2670932.1 sigma-70 family RNA polymerase sigma factor [Deltaproteobacteria bacterium]
MAMQPGLKSENVRVSFIGDDSALAKALKANQPGAREALYDKYATHVRGVLVRTLGTNVELQDHLHNVFIEAFSSTSSIRDDSKLKSWLTSVTVYTAIAHIRKTSRKRWLIFSAPDELPDVESHDVDSEKRQALTQVYQVLEKMSVKERIPFSLRIIDGMPLQDVAEACDVSLATIKRRITKAKQRFAVLARSYPLLQELMDNDESWRQI